ncbi:MAG: hypothetical protein IT307_12595 [Chloroflexi bacterium]|nr:hypothetical protein [Chloroflexota bacterium]
MELARHLAAAAGISPRDEDMPGLEQALCSMLADVSRFDELVLDARDPLTVGAVLEGGTGES